MNEIITTLDAVNKALDTPRLDPIFLGIANDFLAGHSIEQLSDLYRLPMDRVTSIIEKREVKAYIDSVYASQGYLNRVKRLSIINAIVDQKMQEGLETGVYTKKDLYDWLRLLNEMEGQVRPKEKGPAVAIQVNNYERFMKDLTE